MSLYWPEQRVAIDIVDDPSSRVFDKAAHPDVTVLPITVDEIRDPVRFNEFAHTLSAYLGTPLGPDTPQTAAARDVLRSALFACMA